MSLDSQKDNGLYLYVCSARYRRNKFNTFLIDFSISNKSVKYCRRFPIYREIGNNINILKLCGGLLMKLLDELQLCIMVIDSLKITYLEKILNDENGSENAGDLIAGQYIAYACCQSILTDLINKHEDN